MRGLDVFLRSACQIGHDMLRTTVTRVMLSARLWLYRPALTPSSVRNCRSLSNVKFANQKDAAESKQVVSQHAVS